MQPPYSNSQASHSNSQGRYRAQLIHKLDSLLNHPRGILSKSPTLVWRVGLVNVIWQDQRILAGEQARVPTISVADGDTIKGRLIEAQGWEQDAQGRMYLVAQYRTRDALDAVACLEDGQNTHAQG